TSDVRRRSICALSSGFVYYLSISGITGEREQLPADLEANLKQLKSMTHKPICVGFGIHRPEHVEQLQGLADGAIVGSAFVRRLTQTASSGGNAEQIAASAADLCRSEER